MKAFLKAALFGAVLAAALFFLPLLFPVLLLLLLAGLIRRAFFGPRWRYAYAGGGCGGPGRYGRTGDWSRRTPTVDGRDWQRPGNADTPGRDVAVN